MALNDTELDYLDKLLMDGDGRALDYVHGLLTALICAPRPTAPRDWLPLVLVGEGALRAEAAGLLLELHNEIRDGLVRGEFQPVLSEVRLVDGGLEVEATDWCCGFAEGMGMQGGQWLQDLDSELADLLYPILAIATDAEPGREGPPLVADEESRDEFTAAIPDRVEAIYAFWHGERGAPLCPCGSGLPFATCCGVPRTLH